MAVILARLRTIFNLISVGYNHDNVSCKTDLVKPIGVHLTSGQDTVTLVIDGKWGSLLIFEKMPPCQ